MEETGLTHVDLAQVTWKKSSRSGGNGGNCVEVGANLPGVVVVRDSKNPAGPLVVCTSDEWRSFVVGVKHHGFGV